MASPDKKLFKESSYFNSNWMDLLKCPICFCYFCEPVNLFCGHTFCKSCLMKMAQNTRVQRPEIPLNRLRMWCPTCRHAIPVRLYIGPDLNVCYILRDLVQFLLIERRKLFRSSPFSCRSVSTQTEGSKFRSITPINYWNSGLYPDIYSDERCVHPEERSVHPESRCGAPFSVEQYYYTTFSDRNENRRDLAPDFSESEMYDTDDDSTEDAEEVQFHDNVNDTDVIHRQELTPRRMWMLLFWVVYTGIMAVISHGFLPYIIVYSLVLLLIIYVDSMQHQAVNSTND